MPPPLQRFCPLCDRAFVEGEAVLRCSGCGVLHHPGCWVTNGGCGTPADHQQNPIALAYSIQPVRPEAPHPGEGTRTTLERPRADDFAEPVDEYVEPVAARPEAGTVPAQPSSVPRFERPAPAEPGFLTEPPAGRPVPPSRFGERRRGAAQGGVKPMPSIYRTHRILRYWFVPVGIALAIFVAVSVVWLVEQFFGGDDTIDTGPRVVEGNPPPTLTPPAVTATSAATVEGAATAAATPTASAPPPGQKFRVGDAALVTASGDCLNVRPQPARSGDPIACVPDGSQLTITGGPEQGDGFKWWKVKAQQGEGWAVEDFLTRK